MIVAGMDKFSVPLVAACVLAAAAFVAVVFVGVWISIGGGPWERFREVVKLVTTMRSS